MAKKAIFWAMLAMVLAFGLTVVGCDDEDTWKDPVIKVENGTAFQVKSVLIEKRNPGGVSFTYTPIKSDPAGISSGTSKSYQITTTDHEGFWVKVTLTVTATLQQDKDITTSDLFIYSGEKYGAGVQNVTLLLSGTDYNSLQLTEIY